MKMTRSDSGKLGAIKSAPTIEKNKQDRVLEYLIEPKLCRFCSGVIQYDKRSNIFCSNSCSATYNNARKDWSNIVTGPVPAHLSKEDYRLKVLEAKKSQEPKNFCANCKSPIAPRKKFCDLLCHSEERKMRKYAAWCAGEKVTPRVVKRYLQEKYGYKCSRCGINEWNNQPIVLELEHKDGNSDNGLEDNLCLMCPNCHSQTPTYKSKNKGSGRHSRRLRYTEGKSY